LAVNRKSLTPSNAKILFTAEGAEVAEEKSKSLSAISELLCKL
jgi:hypothetical protein